MECYCIWCKQNTIAKVNDSVLLCEDCNDRFLKFGWLSDKDLKTKIYNKQTKKWETFKYNNSKRNWETVI